VKVCPANVIVPVKLLPVVLAGALNDTVPLPVPDVGGVIVRKDAVVAAVHGHDDADAVNVKLPVPPAAGRVPVAALRVKVQAAAAACVKVTAWPATVRIPVRLVVLVLGSRLYCSAPLPMGPLTESKPALCAARRKETFDEKFQTHELLLAVTVIVPMSVPPAADTDSVSGFTT